MRRDKEDLEKREHALKEKMKRFEEENAQYKQGSCSRWTGVVFIFSN